MRHQDSKNPPLDFKDPVVVDLLRKGGVLVTIDGMFYKRRVYFLTKEYAPGTGLTEYMFRSIGGDGHSRTLGWDKFVEKIVNHGSVRYVLFDNAAEFTRWLRDNEEYTL